MPLFDIEVRETLARTVRIEAADEGEALAKADDMYRQEDIVLDAGDYQDWEVESMGQV